MTIHDKDRRPLEGSGTYRLNVPANAPVKLYWSATIYDRATHALIRGKPWSSRSSNTPKLQKNADGSVDVFFGPKAPPGKDSNWIPTTRRAGLKSSSVSTAAEAVLRQEVGAAGHRTDRSAVRMEVAMKYLLIQMCAGLLMAASVVNVHAQPAGTAVPVTVDNFKRAETDMYLAGFVKEGAFRKFFHHRDLPVENTGVRPNRDTLYSYAVFDLDAGPVTVALPDAGNSRKHARTSAISRSGRTVISICSATSPRRSRGSAISRRAAALPRSPRHGGSATSTASPRVFRSRRTAAPLSR